jgi:hypothetical protein
MGRREQFRFVFTYPGCTGDELLQTPLERRALEEEAPVAGEASQADIGAEAGDLPVCTAAGVGLLQPHHVAEGELQGRG